MAKKNKLRLSKLYSFSCVRPDVAETELATPIGGLGFSRIVYCNQPEMHMIKPAKYCSNYVSTTKYSILSFFPKALFEQFRRVANLYFLFAAALSLTPLAPVAASSLIAPLVFVIGVSMVKEAIEDWRRFLQDKEINHRKVKVHMGNGTFMPREWKKLRVGDVVKVEKDNFFPSDLLILSSSYPDGICYVETMNLDGETNLKLKKCIGQTVELDEDGEFEKFQGIVKCEDPNSELYTFVGNLEYVGEVLSIGPQQILLRDSKLRNTQFIYGVVIFSGHDSKVMQNATTPPSKRSTIERKMDYVIYFLFAVLLLIASAGSIVFGIRTDIDMPNWWYMQPDTTTVYYDPKNAAKAAFLHFVTALILYGYLIPISLYVSIEVVKVLQTTFINQDRQMYHEETDKPANARTSNLNEELGQVHTILSDKTGTLTCNMMEFLKCSIAGTSYGHGITEVEKATAKRLGRDITEFDSHAFQNGDDLNGQSGIKMTMTPHVKGFNFNDSRLMNGNWIHEPDSDVILMFFRILAVCQTAIPEENEATGEISFEAESPDEGAFVIAAREFGFEFFRRTQTSVIIRELDPTLGKQVQREYQILNLLEFNSTRKRMSVILRDEDGQIFLFCKGADSVIFERLGKQGRLYEVTTREHLAKYGDAGLRTLALAYRKLDESEYTSWNAIFLKAKTTIGLERDAMLDSASELIERDLFFIGATAVEDKLQKGVPECIDRLAQAGLKIWVLTGDKLETAINIGFACSLLRQGMKQIMISLDMPGVKLAQDYGDKETTVKVFRESISQQIVNGQQEVNVDSSEETAFALIIDGKALSYALEDTIKHKFLQLAISCASVICCRVSPKQKAMVTKLVREGTGRTTLAIGDGANDVGMIQEADIGVGISGVEGMQAVMASDFAIAQFRFLEQLLIVHGHWCYKRIATMICYFFYKNITFGLTLFYYEATTSFSGQSAYNDWFMSLFNVIFTSLPVLALGVFEQDVSARVCLQFPALYQQGPRNMFFNWPRILGWISNGFYGSLVIFIFSACSLQYQAFSYDGKVAGLEILGVTMYSCAICAVNCQIALAISHFTWVQHVFIWGSILVWYAFLVVYGFLNPLLSTTAYRVFLEAAASAPAYWLIVLLIVVSCLLPYFCHISAQRIFHPLDHHIIQEIRYLEKDKRDPGMWKREQAKAVHKTSIGPSARVEARVRQLKDLLNEPL